MDPPSGRAATQSGRRGHGAPARPSHGHRQRGAPGSPGGAAALLTLKRWLVVEVAAALGLPLPTLGAVVGGSFGGPFELGGDELQAHPELMRC
jgi:hypothetical protein